MSAPREREAPDPDELLARAEEGLRLAESLDADAAEVYLWHGRTHELRQNHRNRSFEESDRSGVSARLVRDGRLTFAKTSGLSDEDVAWAVRQAARSAALVPGSGSFEGFADARPVERGPTEVHEALAEPDPDRLRGVADLLEDAALEDPATNYFSERLHTKSGLFAVANTQGVRAWDRHAHESFRLEVRASEGDTHRIASTLGSARRPVGKVYDLEARARGAVQRARKATDPTELDGLVDGIILDALCCLLLLGKLTASFDGRAAREDRSVFAGRLGERVASKALTITDKPHGPGGCRHQRVDDEGVPTRETPLIEDGRLANYVYDWRGARDTDEAPTGHGLRSLTDRYGGGPSSKPVNPVVQPGDATLDEMVAAADEAVLVRDAMMGSFTMDPLSGDFSLVAPLAFHVDGGEVQDALPSTTLSGNLFDALQEVRAVGSEATTFPRGSYVPIHLGGVTCST